MDRIVDRVVNSRGRVCIQTAWIGDEFVVAISAPGALACDKVVQPVARVRELAMAGKTGLILKPGMAAAVVPSWHDEDEELSLVLNDGASFASCVLQIPSRVGELTALPVHGEGWEKSSAASAAGV